MNIRQVFTNGKVAVIPFITCGYPDLEMTEQIIYALEKAGADLIELGIPFSDASSEALALQEASQHALRRGVTTDHIFDLVERVRDNTTIPLAFKTYANVVFSYGTERFAEKAAQVGVEAIILPDVPFEERDEFASVFRPKGMELIPYVAPASADRIRKVAREARGFISIIPSNDVQNMVENLRQFTATSVAVELRASQPEEVVKMANIADGVVLESAIMELVIQHGKEAPDVICDYVSSIVALLNEKLPEKQPAFRG